MKTLSCTKSLFAFIRERVLRPLEAAYAYCRRIGYKATGRGLKRSEQADKGLKINILLTGGPEQDMLYVVEERLFDTGELIRTKPNRVQAK